MPDRCDLGLSATAATHVTAAGTMAASVARVPVAESRLHRAVSGRLRRPPRGPLRGGSGRVRRRAVGLRGFVYFVGTHTRSTVPLGRSAAALGAIIEGPQILVILRMTRVGKGLKSIQMCWPAPVDGIRAQDRPFSSARAGLPRGPNAFFGNSGRKTIAREVAEIVRDRREI